MDTIEAQELARKRLRRSWSDEEKRSICAQARMPDVSVAQVARRYSMNANLIFNWLRDPRFQPEVAETNEPVFLPVKVSATPMARTPSLPDQCLDRSTSRHIEIFLSNGHRLSIEGDFDGDALAQLLKGLAS